MSLSMTAAIAPSQPGQLGEYWITYTYIRIIHCWVDFTVFLHYFYHLPFQYGLVVIRTITDHLWYTHVCMYRYVHHIFGPLITSVDSAAVCVYLCMCVWLCVCRVKRRRQYWGEAFWPKLVYVSLQSWTERVCHGVSLDYCTPFLPKGGCREGCPDSECSMDNEHCYLYELSLNRMKCLVYCNIKCKQWQYSCRLQDITAQKGERRRTCNWAYSYHLINTYILHK